MTMYLRGFQHWERIPHTGKQLTAAVFRVQVVDKTIIF